MTKKAVYMTWAMLLVSMAWVIAVSNYLVQFPLNDWITLGAFTYPMAFLITDLTNKTFGKEKARIIVLYGFILGVILSFFTSEYRIAIASGSAFVISQLIDIQVFSALRKSAWWRAPVISSTIGSCIDTLLFFSIAFYATGVNWPSLALGDLAVKGVMLLVLLPPYRWLSMLLARNIALQT